MDIGSIRDGLKTRLATVSGLRTYDTAPDKPEVPAAVVLPDDPFINYHEAMNAGLAILNFRVIVVVNRATVERAQDALDGYLSSGTGESSSLIDAIEADGTLGGNAADVIVDQAGRYGSQRFGTIDYGTAELSVRVIEGRT